MSRITKSRSLNSKPILPSNIRAVDQHLKNLHRLKTQVQQLDIVRVPHKQPPITRNIKQLIDISSQILRKRQRNQLGTNPTAINNLIQALGQDQSDIDKGLIEQEQLKKKMDLIFKQKHDISIINNHQDAKIKTKDIGDFLTHNQCADFDPLEAAFKMLDPNNNGYIDYKSVVELMNVLQIDLISKETIAKLLGIDKIQNLTFAMFKKTILKFEGI